MELIIQKAKNGKNIKKMVNSLNKEPTLIGIDPGASGGVSWIDSSYNIKAEACPKTNIEMADLINKIVIKSIENSKYYKKSDMCKCYIELVHAFPTDGRSSAFKFGRNYGTWLGILASHGIEPVFITPQKWQKYYGHLPKIKKERKNKMKEIASDLSELKATLKTSDAILIAIYGYNQSMQTTK